MIVFTRKTKHLTTDMFVGKGVNVDHRQLNNGSDSIVISFVGNDQKKYSLTISGPCAIAFVQDVARAYNLFLNQ